MKDAGSKDKVILMTWAHNAEKTLRVAIDSVLSQTYTNIVYLVLDNASTDGTGDIIQEYAARDPRVRYLFSGVNIFNIFHNVQLIDEEYEWFAVLDADDEYTPDFLEKSLAFAGEEDLDIVCCGTEFVDAVTLKKGALRQLFQKTVLSDAKSIDDNFTECYQFIRPIWGKLVSYSVMSSIDFKSLEETTEFSNGLEDTYFSIEAFKNARRLGILNEVLHRYYVHKVSAYRTFHPKRFRSHLAIYRAGVDFLLGKCGSVSEKSNAYLLEAYGGSIADTVKLIADTPSDFSGKAAWYKEILTHGTTKSLFNCGQADRESLSYLIFSPILKWVSEQPECYGPKGSVTASEIITEIKSLLKNN
jgi:glycosyltransferase involved in cell wall biosynthesis